jgi:hypothetical protein
MRGPRQFVLFGVPCLLAYFAAFAAEAQEPVPSAPSTAPNTSVMQPAAQKTGNPAYSHANDYLIHGTIFDDKALAFPNVELRIRRGGEKKFRWRSFTNSRGEFAVRVPKGAEYEMVVSSKGFKDQVRKIDAKSGALEESATLRMELVTGSK